MSTGPVGGVFGSAAGAPLSQTKGSEAERGQRETSAQQRTNAADQKAEQAAGIGQTQEDSESSERDADGRRPWEIAGRTSPEEEGSDQQESRQAKDPSGETGNNLDLTG